jgi:hypothetical protein
MPAPPDGLTPAMATLLMDDRTSSRTVSAAMVDLAARGLLRFRRTSRDLRQEDEHRRYRPGGGDHDAGGRPVRGASATWVGPDGFVPTTSARALLPAIGQFKSDLETSPFRKGWLTGKPTRVIGIWMALAAVEGGRHPALLLDAVSRRERRIPGRRAPS